MDGTIVSSIIIAKAKATKQSTPAAFVRMDCFACNERLPNNQRVLKKMTKASQQAISPILASDKAAALALTPVSRETESRLDRYVALLLEMAGPKPIWSRRRHFQISGPGIFRTRCRS